jgi:hyaluronoglucosaminidase
MIPELGLIEGFFGRPWTWRERAETIAALRPHGYLFYLYAPKADAFLRRNWQQPHPDAEMEALARLAAHCRALGVRFGIGLSPFELHLAPERGWQDALTRKLSQLDALRPDDLAILFDDMRGDVPELAARQAAIVAFAAERTHASRILCCPSYYSDDPVLDAAFGKRPDLYLRQLGKLLDPSVEVFWTGPEVCSREFSPGHLARVAGELDRKPFLWDNYPVNDGARMAQHLHLRAFTGRPASISHLIAGHGINPASQPMLSRIPALTLADSYRSGDAYDYEAAFRLAAREVAGTNLADRLRKDLLTVQDRGLDRIAPNRRRELRDIYAGFAHPAAQEVVAWLDGQWNVTGELVQTQ